MVSIRPDEISAILKQQIEDYDKSVSVSNVGSVLTVGDGIARVYGLQQAMAGELLEFDDGTEGIALNLEDDNVGAVLMGEGYGIQEGSTVKATGKIASVPVGEAMLGRVVNSLGRAIDGKGEIATSETRLIESMAPGIIQRKSVHEPMQTGITAIDAMIPVGRGQRELIIGDRQTGKTAIAIDTILNQKDQDMICVYVAVGQKAASVANVVEVLRERGALDYSVIVAANASEPAALQYLAPYTGASIAEYFMYKGKATLVICDEGGHDFADGVLKDRLSFRAHHLLLLDFGDELRLVGLEVITQFAGEVNHLIDGDRIDEALDAGINNGDLLSQDQRAELGLLQKFPQALATLQLLLGGSIEVGCELGEGGQLSELSQFQLQGAGNLLDRLGLGGTTHPAHGDTHVDGGTKAGVEQVGAEEDLPVRDRDHIGGDVGRHVTGLGFDDR